MRITIDSPDTRGRWVKIRAAQEDRSLKDLVSHAFVQRCKKALRVRTCKEVRGCSFTGVGRILCVAILSTTLCAFAAPMLRISEVMSSDNTAFADEDGDCEDWVELVNTGDASVPLAGWGLTDDAAGEPLKWTFPDITLTAGEYLLVWASGKDRRPPRKSSEGPLVIAPSNTVWRYRDNGLAPEAGWNGTHFDDSAWASGPAMLGYGFSKVTTAVSYGGVSTNKYPATYFRQTFVSPVSTNDTHGSGILRLWVDDGAIITLNGEEILRVRMPAGTVTEKTFASTLVNANGAWESFEVPVTALVKGTNVLAAEVHQINVSSSDIALWAELSVRLSQLHTNFKMSAGNETVTLSTPEGTTVDAAPPLSVLRDASYGRRAGEPDGPWLMFPYPTPGTTNSAVGYSGLLEPPGFTVPPGFYASDVTVALTNADPSALIYYTLDGSTPTNAATSCCFLYTTPLTLGDRSSVPNGISLIRTNPIEMTNNTQYGWMAPQGLVPKANVLRATAFKDGWFSPRGAAGTWFVGGAPLLHTLKVFSLMSDYDNLFGDPCGLFVPGDIYNALGWNGQYVGLPNANYFQYGDAWERPIFVQLFETDRTLAITQLMGVRNHGAWSRGAAQKTLLMYAREEYGDSQVDYALFPDQKDTGFKRFLLRNSGNDWSSVGFRDAMMQQVFRPSARCGTQDYTPAVIYVNGEYWGVENIREHYSKYYLERHYGVDPDNVDLLKAQVSTEAMEIQEGDDLDYKEVLAFTKTNDLSQAANYAWVESRMDLDNLIDHYACEIYCCNTDWPGNNLGVWRVRTSYNPGAAYGHDGRWRWLTYDTDHGFGLSSSETTDMMTQARRSSRGVCQPQFDRLLANTDFQNRFVNRFADLINTAFRPARVQGIISDMALRVESEMPRHIARWGRMGSYSTWQSNVQRLKTFANGRPGPALTNLVNEFGLNGLANLTVSITNGAGTITVNSITITETTPGLTNSAAPYPWRGVYFQTVPVTVSATPAAGFAFEYWKTPAGQVLDQTFALTLSNDVEVCAVFEPAVLPRVTVNECLADASKVGGDLHPTTGKAEDWFELLNESSMTVDLSGYWVVDSQTDNACRIPDGVTLSPGKCLRVWTGSELVLGVNADGSINATFGLSKSGDAVALQTPDRTTELDRVTFDAQVSNVSQGRWPNGASGSWVSFTKPTPGKPNRNPTATAGLLPLYTVQSVVSEQTLALSFAPVADVSEAVYTVIEGQTGAAINAAGMFTWTPPVTVGSGVYAFRIALLGLLNGVAVTDETTLLVAVSNTQRYQIEALASPVQGGAVSGGGAYEDGATVTLMAVPAETWRFSKWSDGVTSATRSFQARHDVTYTAKFSYDLATTERASGTIADGLPLLYWASVIGAEGYVVRRAASPAGPFAAIGAPTNNVFIDDVPLVGLTGYYTVAASHGTTEGTPCASFQAFTNAVTRKLAGAVIGTLGSYGNNVARTRDKVFDSDIATFYDAAADGGWPGWDIGSDRLWRLAYLRYVPRESLPARMVNGTFQISSTSDGVDTFVLPETLYTITTQPPTGVYTQVSIQFDKRFRYLRYLPPTGGWGNIAELEVYGYDAMPTIPTGLTATSGVGSVTLTWCGVTNTSGYLVQRMGAGDSSFTAVAYVETGVYAESNLTAGATYSYRVAALNGSSISATSAAVAITSETPLVIPCFAARSDGGCALACGQGRVTLQLSGALDSRLELVCSETLETPFVDWSPVAAAAFTEPDPVSGAVTVSIVTQAPKLFFAVRVK